MNPKIFRRFEKRTDGEYSNLAKAELRFHVCMSDILDTCLVNYNVSAPRSYIHATVLKNVRKTRLVLTHWQEEAFTSITPFQSWVKFQWCNLWESQTGNKRNISRYNIANIIWPNFKCQHGKHWCIPQHKHFRLGFSKRKNEPTRSDH